MAASSFVAHQVLDCYLRGTPITPPARVYLSLHTDDPGDDGSNEVSLVDWPSYQRVDAAQGGAVGSGFTVPAMKMSANALQLLFPAKDGPTPSAVPFFGLWDAATGGNFLFGGALENERTFLTDDELVAKAASLVVTVI